MESFFLTRSGKALMFAVLGVLLCSGCTTPSLVSGMCTEGNDNVSLATHMASMEVHLNRLFRQFGQGKIDEHSEEDASALLELQRKSVVLVPEAWCDLSESERATRVEQYCFRALQMVELLEDLLACVRNRELELAKKYLETIDQYRRECHVRFG